MLWLDRFASEPLPTARVVELDIDPVEAPATAGAAVRDSTLAGMRRPHDSVAAELALALSDSTLPGTRPSEGAVAVELALALEADEAEAAEPVWDLPNLDHPRVEQFVDIFTGRSRKKFAGMLERLGRYQPMISAKLAERGMPQDLIYLAMIESGFEPKAYSHAHASGLWQFIAATGRRYGLDINRAVDERNDPERATEAALDYLAELHERFGSWYLAAAAYNTGENRVGRIMRQVTGRERGNEASYYRIRSRLPRETREYVPLMVAAARIAKEPHRYGFAHIRPESPLAYDSVVVGPATSLASVARKAGTTVNELKRLNPHFKLSRTRNDMHSAVRIPVATRLALEGEAGQSLTGRPGN
jgi:membrane-bound lytic murein transglycosylase D